jgi:hypothetical protein
MCRYANAKDRAVHTVKMANLLGSNYIKWATKLAACELSTVNRQLPTDCHKKKLPVRIRGASTIACHIKLLQCRQKASR